MTRQEFLDKAKEELYASIQAIEDGDLPFARSSAARAASLITDGWQADRPAKTDTVQLTKGVSVGPIKLTSTSKNTGRSMLGNLLRPSDD
jgi:hypothetical protein